MSHLWLARKPLQNTSLLTHYLWLASGRHSYFLFLFQRRARLAAQADAIEVSARELIAKLPEEIPEEEREARKDGNSSKFSFNAFFHPEY